MFDLHESLIDGGADGAARSHQACLLRPPPQSGPIAEFVGTIAQLPLPWRPQIRDLVRMGVIAIRCLVKVLASFVPHFGEHKVVGKPRAMAWSYVWSHVTYEFCTSAVQYGTACSQ